MSKSSDDAPYRPLMVERKYAKSWLKKQREEQERILRQHPIAIQAWEIFFYMKEDEVEKKEVEKKEVKKIEEYESESYEDDEDYYESE